MYIPFDFHSIVSNKSPSFLLDSIDWMEWRFTYSGGRIFRDQYLVRYDDRETYPEFIRRRDLTPIPTYAKREVNRVRNSLYQRFGDILRRGGSKTYQDAIAGNSGGVDRKGASMNTFLGRDVLPDLLVMGRVGVLVDAPPIHGETLADTPSNFSPYAYCYPVEQVMLLVEADNNSKSDYQSVLLMDKHSETSYRDGTTKDSVTYRYYWMDEETGKCKLQLLDNVGAPSQEEITLDMESIPFVMFDIGDSLIKDVCRHQIALLNLISSDTNYALDANFPFLTKQTGNDNAGSHLKGEDTEEKVGLRKGIKYAKALDRPGFISPPTEPMSASLELRRELKEEVRELVSGAIADLGDDGTLDSGLAFIGLMLEACESRIADHWAAYENKVASSRKIPTVKYPEQWTLKTNKERIEEASSLAETMYKVPGRLVKKEIAKLAADALLRGKVPTDVLDRINKEIDEAPYCTSDPDIITKAKKAGLISGQTGSMALGGTEDEWEKAEEDQAKRAAAIVAAQADSAAARGNPDGSVDPASAELDKEGSADNAAKLGGDDDEGQRGEGLDNLDEEDEDKE